MWRSVERLEEAAQDLVKQGLVAQEDEFACYIALLRAAEMLGFQQRHTTKAAVGVSAFSPPERRALVERYIAFSGTAKSDNERAEKLRAMGVSKHQMHKWAKQFAPGLLTETNVPRHRVILELVQERPWMTLPEIVGASGLARQTTISGLYKLWQRNELVRRKGRMKLYEYALPGTLLRDQAETSAVAHLQSARGKGVSGRGRAA